MPTATSNAKDWRIVHTECSLGWGGQERRIMAELTGFRDRGVSVWLVAPAPAKVLHRAQACGISTRSLSSGKLRYPFTVLALARWLRNQRIRILNPHSSRDAWLAGLAGRIAGVPFIVRSRHFDVPIRNPRVSRRVYCNLADHIITTSPKISTQLRELFQLPDDRVSTVPTGIDLNLFRPDGPHAPLPPSVPRFGVPVIGMVGVFRRAKGHRILLEAAAKLRDSGFIAHYLLVGEGPMLETTRQKVIELKLTPLVTFTGEREDIPELLRSLHLIVIPSLHEGIPQVALQALGCRTPVIGSNVGGIPSVIREGETGRIVPAEDPDALAMAIRAAFDQAEHTRSLSDAGRRLVEKEHGLETMLNHLQQIYERHL